MPDISQVHVNMALTNVSLAYKNPAFISDILAPVVGVRKQQDNYFILDPEREAFRSTPDHRSPGAVANEVDFSLSTDSYYCGDHALTSIVPDEERDNADPAIQPDIDRTEFLSDKINLNKEIELANLIATDGSLTSITPTGDDQWSDVDSDPIAAMEIGRNSIIENCQVIPNTLVLPHDVYASLRQHPAVLSRLQYTSRGAPTTDILAELFDVEHVLVPRAVRNTSLQGATPTIEYVWGKNAFLTYVAPRPGLKTVSFAMTFAWSAAPGAMGGRMVDTWREATRKGDMVRVQRYYDQKVVASDAIYIWKSVVA